MLLSRQLLPSKWNWIKWLLMVHSILIYYSKLLFLLVIRCKWGRCSVILNRYAIITVSRLLRYIWVFHILIISLSIIYTIAVLVSNISKFILCIKHWCGCKWLSCIFIFIILLDVVLLSISNYIKSLDNEAKWVSYLEFWMDCSFKHWCF